MKRFTKTMAILIGLLVIGFAAVSAEKDCAERGVVDSHCTTSTLCASFTNKCVSRVNELYFRNELRGDSVGQTKS